MGAAYILGKNAFDGGDLANADVRFYSLNSAAGGGFGSIVVPLGDIDADGNEDVGFGWSGYTNSRGALAIYLGPFSGGNDAADADAFVTGLGSAFVTFHAATARAGDTDGDGTDDLVFGAPETHQGSDMSYAGQVYLVSGGGVLSGTDVQLADATIEGTHYAQQLGRSVTTMGDQDGDGFADIGVGAWGDDTEADYGGGAFLFYGPLSGTSEPGDADASWHGVSRGASAGVSVIGGVELTGDSYADLVIGAEAANGTADYSGIVYVVPGGP